MDEKTKTEASKPGRHEVPVTGNRGDFLSHLREEIDDLFDDWSWHWPMRPRRGPHGWFGRRKRDRDEFGWSELVPAMDVVDKGKEIQVRAELPGMDEKDIDVTLSDSTLTISGEKKQEREQGDEDSGYYLAERRYGAFRRTLPLPDGIDRDQVSAAFRKGVLTIHLPRTPEARESTRKVEVKGA